MTNFRGAHVIVTGGSEGIGYETAAAAAASGATVSLIARRGDVLAEAAERLERRAGPASGPVHHAAADVGDPEATQAAVDALTAAAGPCDVVVCCAGYALPGYFDELPIDEFDRHMRVNYLGAVHAIRAVLPEMRRRGRGHVAVTSSTAGIIGVFGYGAYSPTKFAVRGLAEVVRAEAGPDGVKVSVIHPPDTRTPGFDRENLTKPPETAALSASITPISAERMAQRVVAGIERDRLQIFGDPTTAVLARAAGLVAPVVRRLSDRTIRNNRPATGS